MDGHVLRFFKVDGAQWMSGRPNAVNGGVFEASERPAVAADLLHIFDSWKSMELNEARECLEG